MTQLGPHQNRVAIAGAASLGVAVGIGRFAFTPLLPMMLHDGTINLAGGSRLATANYIGYLAGALLSMALAARCSSTALLKAGLAATVIMTLAMALPVAGTWPALRLLAGIASAVTFIFTSGWCFAELARLGRPALGSMIFTGPGIGIVVCGLAAALVQRAGGAAGVAWLVLGLLALLLSVGAWPVFSGAPPVTTAPVHPPPSQARQRNGGQMALLATSYGLAGFGYIITATFLPVIAGVAVPGSPLLGLFWPIFGTGAAIGSWAATRLPAQTDHRLVLMFCHVCQALGVALGIVAPTAVGFVAGSVLAGLPFTAISYFALREGRRLRPQQAARFIGLLTGLYGAGQIAGPPLVAVLLARSSSTSGGFALALGIAAAALAVGALLYAVMCLRWRVADS